MKLKAIIFSIFTFCTALLHAQSDHVPGEVLVQFSTKANPKNLMEYYSDAFDFRIALGELLSKPMHIYKVNFDAQKGNENTILRLFRNDKNILNAQFNHYISQRDTTPNDIQYGSQWYHVNDGSNGTVDADIDSDLAWDITTGGLTALGDTIVACVIEGGNLNHSDLIDNAWLNYHEIPNNGIDDDANGYIDDYRGWNVDTETDAGLASNNHGTGVLGMIGATGNNNLNLTGINWNVKLMVVGGEDLYDEASVIEAYTYPLIQRRLYEASGGELGAFVVVTNASWGIDGGNPADVPIWAALYDTLGAAGILNCGATTNNDVNVDVVGDIPTAVPSDFMISVTATNSNDFRTFSGYGQTTIDLGAPGQNVITTAGSNGTTITSGTSFASPLTAGVVALLYSAPCTGLAELAHSNPQLAAYFVRYALLSGVDPIENLTLETVTGGRLNAFNSLSIITQVCDSAFCVPPINFAYTLTNDTIYTFSWTAAANTTPSIRFKESGATGWNYISNIDSTVFQIDTLAHCSNYIFQIAGTCAEQPVEADFSSAFEILTKGCCVPPSVATLTDISENAVELSWTPGLDIEGYAVYYRPSADMDWILSGIATDGNQAIEGLEPCSDYSFLIVPNCLEGTEDGLILTTTTPGCGFCLDTEYCPSGSETTFYEFLDKVEIGTFVNESGNNDGYFLFENLNLELARGQDYEVTFTPGFGSFGIYLEYFVAWIDFDKDGIFSADEKIFQSESASSQPAIGEITIPSQVQLGSNRLRISMKASDGNPSEPDPCTLYNYGETEDYCITILDEIDKVENPSLLSLFHLFPNPSTGNISLDFKPSNPAVATDFILHIIDLTGKKVVQQSVAAGRNDITTSLTPGIYLIQLLTGDKRVLKSDKLVILN